MEIRQFSLTWQFLKGNRDYWLLRRGSDWIKYPKPSTARKQTQSHLCYLSSSSSMCWANADHTSGLLDHLGIVHHVNVVHIWPACTTGRSKIGNIKKAKHATLASLGIWPVCTHHPGLLLTTATLWSTPPSLQFLFGLKRSALQEVITCFPPASWPLYRGDFREPL